MRPGECGGKTHAGPAPAQAPMGCAIRPAPDAGPASFPAYAPLRAGGGAQAAGDERRESETPKIPFPYFSLGFQPRAMSWALALSSSLMPLATSSMSFLAGSLPRAAASSSQAMA